MLKVRILCFLSILLITGCAAIVEKQDPAAIEEELSNAEKLYQSGNVEEAKKAFEKILSKNDTVVQANYRLGNIAFKQSRFDIAEKYYTKAVATEPKFNKAHYNLAVTHLILAENHLKYFVATAPENADIEKVSKIIVELDKFADGSNKAKVTPPSSLEKISGELKGQYLGEP